MSGHGERFSRKKEEAILALMTHRTVEEASRAIGVASKTLLRWQRQPEFQEALRQARRDAFSQSVGRLQQAASAAASTLLKLMVDPSTPASSRLRAAVSVLELGQRGVEGAEARTRLELTGEKGRPVTIEVVYVKKPQEGGQAQGGGESDE